jgi:hypothetical protein
MSLPLITTVHVHALNTDLTPADDFTVLHHKVKGTQILFATSSSVKAPRPTSVTATVGSARRRNQNQHGSMIEYQAQLSMHCLATSTQHIEKVIYAAADDDVKMVNVLQEETAMDERHPIMQHANRQRACRLASRMCHRFGTTQHDTVPDSMRATRLTPLGHLDLY